MNGETKPQDNELNQPQKEEKEFLARNEVKTMKKDMASLRETESKEEMEKMSKIKTEEEVKRETERKKRAEQESKQREESEKEMQRKEDELKKMKKEREKNVGVMEKEASEKKELKTQGLQDALRQTQTQEETERKRFLERVAAKAEGHEAPLAPKPPVVQPPVVEPQLEKTKPFQSKVLSLKRPTFAQKVWIRVTVSFLIMALLAGVGTFWYWYFVVRTQDSKQEIIEVVETDEIIDETVPTEPEITKPPVTKRFIEVGYQLPTDPRLIDTIIIHSTYNVYGEDAHNIEGVVQEYEDREVAAHYVIDREGIIYQLAPDEAIAYHAGLSQMPDGRKNVNNFSIGVEVIYTKNENPTSVQYQSLIFLIKRLKEKYSIDSNNILGHQDIVYQQQSETRKNDPWNFDWQKLNNLIK